MKNQSHYFADYEAYTEHDMTAITPKGISLKNGGFIDFSECARTYSAVHSIDESLCVGERDITDFSFVFYTFPKATMIKFIEKNKLLEFFTKRDTLHRFYELQKKINKFGYKTYDMS